MEQAVPYKEGFITELMKAEEELQEAESYIQDMEEKDTEQLWKMKY